MIPSLEPISKILVWAVGAKRREKKRRRLVSGKFLLSLGMKPGPELGKLIRESFELQLEGDLADGEAAEKWARERTGL